MREQKSAEAIVAGAHPRRANHEEPSAAPRSMHDADAAPRTETSSRTRTVTRGTGDGTSTGRQTSAARGAPGGTEALMLIEQVVRRENLVAAHARVVRNGGAPGIDGMTVDELMSYCRQHWARIREQLLSGT